MMLIRKAVLTVAMILLTTPALMATPSRQLLLAQAAVPTPAQTSPQAQEPDAPAAKGPASSAPAAVDTPNENAMPRGIGPIPHELSPWSMFLSADIVVQAVMLSLAFASFATWTIFLAISAKLLVARQRLTAALSGVAQVRTISEAQLAIGADRTVLSSFLRAAMQEIRVSAEVFANGAIEQRAATRFSEIARAEARSIRHGMGVLATVGATAPFVGLFGTVWGIMNSFIGISKAQTTNLAVVAPGIAEALLATACGLIAAIPAVIVYNHLSRSTKSYLELVSRASGATGRLLSRDLDRAAVGTASSNAAE
jgi:biopolymer transport protein ExbB